MPEQISNSRFGLWKKWFWIGIVAAIANIVVGLIYGIALVVEKDHRKEGIIIIVFAIVWVLFVTYFLGPWLIKTGVVPHYQLFQLK